MDLANLVAHIILGLSETGGHVSVSFSSPLCHCSSRSTLHFYHPLQVMKKVLGGKSDLSNTKRELAGSIFLSHSSPCAVSVLL